MSHPFDQHVESDPAWDLAVRLWCRYHIEAEAYNRRVCSGTSKDGTALPVGGLEHGLVNKNAKRLRRMAFDEGAGAGLPQEMLREAEIVVGHWPLALQQAIYETLNRSSP
jgi:hypothetical protein